MARPSCLKCARKHVAEAEVLMREALMNYCLHAWYAIGHLAQAEAELLSDHPEMAHTVRTERINYMDGLEYSIIQDGEGELLSLEASYQVDTLPLLQQLTVLAVESPDPTEAPV